MTDKKNASISFEDVWKSLEKQDKTGLYKRAREMAAIAVEQLEYAYNSGYETAEAKYARPQGQWIIADKVLDYYHECPFCHWRNEVTESLENFCPNCGADMRKGNVE